MKLITNLGLEFKFWLEKTFPGYKDNEISVYLANNHGYVLVFPNRDIQYVAAKLFGSTYALYLNDGAIEDSHFEGNCWNDMNRGFYSYIDYTESNRSMCNIVYPKYMIVDKLRDSGIVLNTQEEIRDALKQFVHIAIHNSSTNCMFRPTIGQIVEIMKGKHVCWLN